MGRESNCSIEEKVQAVLDYKKGARSIEQICIDLGMSEAMIISCAVHLIIPTELINYSDVVDHPFR